MALSISNDLGMDALCSEQFVELMSVTWPNDAALLGLDDKPVRSCNLGLDPDFIVFSNIVISFSLWPLASYYCNCNGSTVSCIPRCR